MLPVLRTSSVLGLKRKWFTGKEILNTLNFVAQEAEHTLDESQLARYWDGTIFGSFIDNIYKKYGLYEPKLIDKAFGAFDTQHRYTKANVKHLIKNMKILNQELFDSLPEDEDMLSSFLHIHYDLNNPYYYEDEAGIFERFAKRSKSKTELELKELLERVSDEGTVLPLYSEWEAVFKYDSRYYTLHQKPNFVGLREDITSNVSYNYPNILFGIVLYYNATEPLAYTILKTSPENDRLFKIHYMIEENKINQIEK